LRRRAKFFTNTMLFIAVVAISTPAVGHFSYNPKYSGKAP
jgi:hypothetical protein